MVKLIIFSVLITSESFGCMTVHLSPNDDSTKHVLKRLAVLFSSLFLNVQTNFHP